MTNTNIATQWNADKAYIRKAMAAPYLSREDEYAYAEKWRNNKDENALHKLTEAHMRLVVAVASRFKNYGLPMGDLIQEGNIGLMLAANRFEIAREVRFSTYAGWWIRSTIQDYVLRNWSIVRSGTTSAQKSLFFNLRKLRSRIERESQAPLNDDGRQQIAKELDVNLSEVETMEMRLSGPDGSLNAPVRHGEDNGLMMQDLLVDDRPTPDQIVIGAHDAKTRARWLNEALSLLSERERLIIQKRKLRHKAETLETLGEELGVSKERVRQLEVRALGKIRQTLIENFDTPLDLI